MAGGGNGGGVAVGGWEGVGVAVGGWGGGLESPVRLLWHLASIVSK